MSLKKIIPIVFDLRGLQVKAKQLPYAVDGVCLSLPFISIKLKIDDVEKNAAKEIVIRLADKRVLNAQECCDNCIKYALDSLQNIRNILVGQQVALKDKTDSGLYLVIEYMLESIRQFLTWCENADPKYDRTEYFASLENLRAHLYRCLEQVALIGKLEIPNIPQQMRYDGCWDSKAYLPAE